MGPSYPMKYRPMLLGSFSLNFFILHLRLKGTMLGRDATEARRLDHRVDHVLDPLCDLCPDLVSPFTRLNTGAHIAQGSGQRCILDEHVEVVDSILRDEGLGILVQRPRAEQLTSLCEHDFAVSKDDVYHAVLLGCLAVTALQELCDIAGANEPLIAHCLVLLSMLH